MSAPQEIVVGRPITAAPIAADFEMREKALAQPGEGQLAVRIIHVSLDPYMVSALRGRHMTPQPMPGQMVPGYCIGQVTDSKAPGFASGDYIAADIGWCSHAVIDARIARKIDPDVAPLSTHLGIAGMPGLTAYASVHRLAEVKEGDAVLVSSAAGPVGGTVGQLARIAGAKRVIGVAGSDEKCRIVTEIYGFDACINYKMPDWKEQLKATCPDGVSVYHDNVGGDMLVTALDNLSNYGRVILCGLASQYNAEGRPPGPNPGTYILKRAKLMGLVVYDFMQEQDAVAKIIGSHIAGGELAYCEDRVEGLESAPTLFEKLAKGENTGKAIVAVAPEKA